MVQLVVMFAPKERSEVFLSSHNVLLGPFDSPVYLPLQLKVQNPNHSLVLIGWSLAGRIAAKVCVYAEFHLGGTLATP